MSYELITHLPSCVHGLKPQCTDCARADITTAVVCWTVSDAAAAAGKSVRTMRRWLARRGVPQLEEKYSGLPVYQRRHVEAQLAAEQHEEGI